jgi:hypothetical protein
MRRWLLGFSLSLLVLGGVLLSLRAKLAERLLDRVLVVVRHQGGPIALSALSHGPVQALGFASVQVQDLRGRAQRLEGRRPLTVVLEAESASVLLESPFTMTLMLRGVHLRPVEARLPAGCSLEQVELSRVALREPLHWLRLKSELKSLRSAMQNLLELKNVEMPFLVTGTVSVVAGQERRALRLSTDCSTAACSLRVDSADLRALINLMDLPVSDAELALMSEHPLAMLTTLNLALEGRRLGAQHEASGKPVTEDSFRHVFWSYGLTHAFGPEFAKRVTDAHEKLPGNTPDEHRMDFHNNAVGRALDHEGVLPDQIEKRILSEPRVVHRPAELARQPHLLQ